MKTLVVVLICVLVMSCGDSEPPTHIIDIPEPMAKPEPEPAEYEIPSDIPPSLAEHFTELQEHMTESEWHLFLDEMNEACDGQPYALYTSNLRNDLSEKAVNAIEQLRKEDKLLPRELNTHRSRIRVAVLAMPDVKHVEFVVISNEIKVVYLKNDYTMIKDLFGTVDKSGVSTGRSGSLHSATNEFNAFDEGRVYCISERISEAWEDQWFEEHVPRWQAGEFADVEPQRVRVRGIVIPTEVELERVREFFDNKFRQPHIPKDLDLLVIHLDEAGNLLSPEEAADLIVDFDDAPQATPAQLEEYNREHSPLAYDCLEEGEE